MYDNRLVLLLVLVLVLEKKVFIRRFCDPYSIKGAKTRTMAR